MRSAAWRRCAWAAATRLRSQSSGTDWMKPTERFSSRVEEYRLYRPGYPAAIVDLLEKECGLTSAARVVDVAAGTGLLSEIFLERGYVVEAIEPNEKMRAACKTLRERW